MPGSARIYVVMMAQFVLKIEKLSHIIGARGSQDLRSPSPIMAPDTNAFFGGGVVASWLVRSSPDRAAQVRPLAADTMLYFVQDT